MNAFFEHHQNNIKFATAALTVFCCMAVFSPSWMVPEHRAFLGVSQIYPVSRKVLREVARQYHHWLSTALRIGGWKL